MTSLLRRKRQTTVPSTSPATIRSEPADRDVVERGLSGLNIFGLFVLIGLLGGLLAVAQSAAAADSDSDNSAAPAVHYSTGKSGSRLAWLPQRPESAQDENTVTPVQYAAPIDPRSPARAVQSLKPTPDPLGDPFGDKKLSAPAAGLKTGPTRPTMMPVEPKVGRSLPALDPEPSTNAPSNTPTTAPTPYLPAADSPAPSDANPKRGEFRTLEQQRELASEADVNQKCPTPKDLKKIGEISTDISASEGLVPKDCPFGDAVFQPRAFPPTTFCWTASALCHKPLYFEDVQLERYGHMWGPLLQPIMSGANFFLTVPILPYKMGLEPMNECIYDLGYYRPGDCAPYLIDPLPLSLRAAFYEASAWAAGAIIIP